MPLAPELEERLHRYSQAVLSVRLGDAAVPANPATDADAVRQAAQRMAARAQGRTILLAGLGDGALPLALRAFAPKSRVIVVELEPEKSRTASARAGDCLLLTDSSTWALTTILFQLGLGPDACAVECNPFVGPEARRKCLRWKHFFCGCTPLTIPLSLPSPAPKPDCALAAILHPDDAGLADFFRQIPSWISQVAVVWDAGSVPESGRDVAGLCAAPVTHAARLLSGDFSSQRNAVLELVDQEWVLFLDADERLEPELWERLPALMAMPFAAWAFPRLTLYPDAGHARLGYGLWPDVQLRLLRRGPRLHFERRIHEVARGMEGQAALLLAGHIRHESWLLKNPTAQTERLAVFNAAAGRDLHRVSADYPSLDVDFFTGLSRLPRSPAALALPGRLE